MAPIRIAKNMVVTGTSSFRIDINILSGEDRIASIAAGGTIDDFNYIWDSDPSGLAREFSFDLSDLNKTIGAESSINVVVRIKDTDGEVTEWGYTKQYAVENGTPYVYNPRINQRRDGTRLVDIEYDYVSPYEVDPATVSLELSDDQGETWDVPILSLAGDVGSGIIPGTNRKITWNPATDLDSTIPVVIVGRLSLTNSYGRTAVGTLETGGILITPYQQITPVVSLTAENEKSRYGNPVGEQFKDHSFDFEAIDSSSESS